MKLHSETEQVLFKALFFFLHFSIIISLSNTSGSIFLKETIVLANAMEQEMKQKVYTFGKSKTVFAHR